MLKRAIINATLNSTGTLVSMLAGVLVMPHLILVMGAGNYGLWTLIGSLSGYFAVLDLGVTPAVGRLIARCRATDDRKTINELMSTAVALLIGVCIALGVASIAAERIFPRIFNVPSQSLEDVRAAIYVVGFTLALSVPAAAFTGFAWAYERFDLLSFIDIPCAAVRAALVLILVTGQHPLFHVAVVNAAVAAVQAIAKIWLSFHISRTLRISVSRIRPGLVRELYAFGIWMNILGWSRTLIPQIPPALIARLVSNSAVTTFSIARQLVSYTNSFAITATQVLAPRAAILNAAKNSESEKALLIDGGRYSHALSLFFVGGFIGLGSCFIRIWQHGSQSSAYGLLVILLLGELLPMSQWMTYSVIIGAGRQRYLATLSIGEGILGTTLCAVVLPRFGLTGMCIVLSAMSFATRGLLLWVFGCRLVELRLAEYWRAVFIPISALAALPIGLVWFLGWKFPPNTWIALIGVGLIYGAAFSAIVGPGILGRQRLDMIWQKLQSRFAYLRSF